MPRANL
jgi:hypothetical protein